MDPELKHFYHRRQRTVMVPGTVGVNGNPYAMTFQSANSGDLPFMNVVQSDFLSRRMDRTMDHNNKSNAKKLQFNKGDME